MATTEPDVLRIVALYSPAPRVVHERVFELPLGATAWQALQASGLLQVCPELQGATLDVGVWGRTCPPSHLLQDGDRLEIYRPLRVDPKVARRERFQGQGVRTAGLFTKRRAGAKAGY
jgi:putative ubiquitin-RnfH superfamily antitoxin RatB of RatAB toxin-antitoxin module